MFTALVEEVLPTLPATQLQLDRINRALAECDGYVYTDRSADYEEPACRVKTLSGGEYLVFANQCTCPDWTERCWGKVDEHGRETACKHILCALFTGNLMAPEDPSLNQGEEVADGYRDGSDWTQEEGEAHAPDLTDREILGIR